MMSLQQYAIVQLLSDTETKLLAFFKIKISLNLELILYPANLSPKKEEPPLDKEDK